MADDDLMTVAEVAGLLKLNRETLYNWISDGTLAHTRVGRGVRIRREDYELLAGASGPDPGGGGPADGCGGRSAPDRQPADGPELDRPRRADAMHVGAESEFRRQDLDAVIEAGS